MPASGQNGEVAIKEELFTDQSLTAILAGISEEDKDKIIGEIGAVIEDCLKDNKPGKIVDVALPDAEKYYMVNYDSKLCWAAVAANSLWTSNLAQISINPETGEYFKTVDEVFDYFRKTFTDKSGRPDGALIVFLKGPDAYPFQNSKLSQVKDGAATVGIPTDIEIPDLGLVKLGKNVDEIKRLEELKFQSLGVLLHSYDNVLDKYGTLAHWVTSPGIIIDENASGNDRYKAIVIADSDNDAIRGDNSIPDAEKAEKAANAPNSYTVYPLKLKYFDNVVGSRWTIPFYYGRPNVSEFDVVIDWISYIGVIPPQEKEPEEEVGPEDDEDGWDDDGWEEDDWDYDWEYDWEDDEEEQSETPAEPAKPEVPDKNPWEIYDRIPGFPMFPLESQNTDTWVKLNHVNWDNMNWNTFSWHNYDWNNMDWQELEEFLHVVPTDRLLELGNQTEKGIRDSGFLTAMKNQMAGRSLDVYSPADWIYRHSNDKAFLVFIRSDPTQLLNVLLDGKLLTSDINDFVVIDENTGLFLLVFSEDVMQNLEVGDHTLTLEINGIGKISRTISVTE